MSHPMKHQARNNNPKWMGKLERACGGRMAEGGAVKEITPTPAPVDSEGRSLPPTKWTPETARKRVGGTFGT